MIGLIAQAIGYGFAAGTAPGPSLSFLVSTTLSYGWRRGLIVVIAPLITDIPIIIVMTFLLEQLPESVISLLQIAGGLFVLWLAWTTWQELQAGKTIGTAADETIQISKRGILWRAVTMNYLSPGPYIFWGTITGPLLREALDDSVLVAIGFLLGFYVTFLLILSLWVILFDRLRHVDPRFTRSVLMITIGILGVLGVVLMLQGVGIV